MLLLEVGCELPLSIYADVRFNLMTCEMLSCYDISMIYNIYIYVCMIASEGPKTAGRSGINIFQLTPGLTFKGFKRDEWTDYFTQEQNFNLNFSFRRRLDQITGGEMIRALAEVLESGDCTAKAINLQGVDAFKWLLPTFRRQQGYNELADPDKLGAKRGLLPFDKKLTDLFTTRDLELDNANWRMLYNTRISERQLASPIYTKKQDGTLVVRTPVKWEWVSASGTQLGREEVMRVKQLRRQALNRQRKLNNSKKVRLGGKARDAYIFCFPD